MEDFENVKWDKLPIGEVANIGSFKLRCYNKNELYCFNVQFKFNIICESLPCFTSHEAKRLAVLVAKSHITSVVPSGVNESTLTV